MNIVVMGAGAIGSFFGGLLSTKSNVLLIGRKPHVNIVRQRGLLIKGKTEKKIKVLAEEKVGKIDFTPDLVILTVKSYDTETAMRQVAKIISNDTFVMSLQNGLDNIEKIGKFVDSKKILLCITTHGIVFSGPGMVVHTGIGKTLIGGVSNSNPGFVKNISDVLNDVGIKSSVSSDIIREMWVKAIVNSCINPVTGIFNCKNGYLLQNSILGKIVERICQESTKIAVSNGIDVEYKDMIRKTHEVISDTSENYSSMLQSIRNGKKTEIASINGKLVEIGKKNKIEPFLNEILVGCIGTN